MAILTLLEAHYIGYKHGGGYDIFHSRTKPTEKSHGHLYLGAAGPFKKSQAEEIARKNYLVNIPKLNKEEFVIEGSEETRQKRAVRRHLNKKKMRPERQDESVQVDESVVVGSIPHMEHVLHAHHTTHAGSQEHETPHYYIHRTRKSHNTESGHSVHQYMVIHKGMQHHQATNEYYRPVHLFNVTDTGSHLEVNHTGHLLNA